MHVKSRPKAFFQEHDFGAQFYNTRYKAVNYLQAQLLNCPSCVNTAAVVWQGCKQLHRVLQGVQGQRGRSGTENADGRGHPGVHPAGGGTLHGVQSTATHTCATFGMQWPPTIPMLWHVMAPYYTFALARNAPMLFTGWMWLTLLANGLPWIMLKGLFVLYGLDILTLDVCFFHM